jgi:hypothetical protein
LHHHRPPPTNAPDSAAGKGAPHEAFGVHVGARAEQRCDDRAIVIDHRFHQRR